MIQGTSAMDRTVGTKRAWSRRLLVPGLVAVVLLAAGVLFLPRVLRFLSTERSVDMSRVRIGVVTRGDLERDLSVQGQIVAAYHPTLFSPVSGIVRVEVRAGDVVEAGQLLAKVESPELASRLKQEQSTAQSLESEVERGRIRARQTILSDRQAVDLAQVELEAATRAMARADRSRAEGILNDVEYEEAQDNLQRAQLSLTHAKENADLQKETLEFEVHNQELQLERQRLVVADLQRQVDELSIRAPVDGLVSRLDVNDHDAVVPGQPLIGIVDLGEFEIEVLIPESYADEMGIGVPARINYDGEVYEGHLKSISPEVEGSQVRGIVTFDGDPPQGLRQNQRVSTRIILESKSDVLKVARGPFLETSGGRQAYRIEGDIATLVPIQIGVTSVSDIEILSGLREGDRIIISETARFQDAERIFLRQ